jgi:hypothetical protein
MYLIKYNPQEEMWDVYVEGFKLANPFSVLSNLVISLSHNLLFLFFFLLLSHHEILLSHSKSIISTTNGKGEKVWALIIMRRSEKMKQRSLILYHSGVKSLKICISFKVQYSGFLIFLGKDVSETVHHEHQ